MFEFIFDNFEIFKELFIFFSFTLISVVLFLKTKDIKYLKEVYDKVKKRNPDYQEKEEKKGQEFERFLPVYRLNKQTNELEETDERVDIVELVNSCKDVAIDNILERFMPVTEDNSAEVVEIATMQDDLDLLRESYSVAEEYRVKYDLPADLSPLQVITAISEKAQDLKSKLANVKNGGAENEKKENIEESEQKDISSDGEQSAS